MTDPYLDAETLYERWATELARTDREPDTALIASIEAVTEQTGFSMVEFAQHKAGQLEPLVAARGAWNPDLHPRGKDGKFIVKFGFITGLFSVLDKKGGKKEGRGRVLDIKPDPKTPGNPDLTVEVINRNGKVVGTETIKAKDVSAAPVSKARLNSLDDADRLATEGVPGRMRNLERDIGAPESVAGVDLDNPVKTDPSELEPGDLFKRRVKLPPDADGNARTGEAVFRVTDPPTKGVLEDDPYSIPSELVAVHGDDGVWADELISPDGARLRSGDSTSLPAGHLGGEQGHVQVDRLEDRAPEVDRFNTGPEADAPDVDGAPEVDGDAARSAINEVERSMELEETEPGFREEWMGRFALAYEDQTGDVLTNAQLDEIADAELWPAGGDTDVPAARRESLTPEEVDFFTDRYDIDPSLIEESTQFETFLYWMNRGVNPEDSGEEWGEGLTLGDKNTVATALAMHYEDGNRDGALEYLGSNAIRDRKDGAAPADIPATRGEIPGDSLQPTQGVEAPGAETLRSRMSEGDLLDLENDTPSAETFDNIADIVRELDADVNQLDDVLSPEHKQQLFDAHPDLVEEPDVDLGPDAESDAPLSSVTVDGRSYSLIDGGAQSNFWMDDETEEEIDDLDLIDRLDAADAGEDPGRPPSSYSDDENIDLAIEDANNNVSPSDYTSEEEYREAWKDNAAQSSSNRGIELEEFELDEIADEGMEPFEEPLMPGTDDDSAPSPDIGDAQDRLEQDQLRASDIIVDAETLISQLDNEDDPDEREMLIEEIRSLEGELNDLDIDPLDKPAFPGGWDFEDGTPPEGESETLSAPSVADLAEELENRGTYGSYAEASKALWDYIDSLPEDERAATGADGDRDEVTIELDADGRVPAMRTATPDADTVARVNDEINPNDYESNDAYIRDWVSVAQRELGLSQEQSRSLAEREATPFSGTDSPVDDDQAVVDNVLEGIRQGGAFYVFNPGENEDAMLSRVQNSLDDYLDREGIELSGDERDSLIDRIVEQGRERGELSVRGRPEEWSSEKKRIATNQKDGAKLKKNDRFVGPDGEVYIVNRKQNGQVIAERAVDDELIDGEMYVKDPNEQRDTKRFDYGDIIQGGPDLADEPEGPVDLAEADAPAASTPGASSDFGPSTTIGNETYSLRPDPDEGGEMFWQDSDGDWVEDNSLIDELNASPELAEWEKNGGNDFDPDDRSGPGPMAEEELQRRLDEFNATQATLGREPVTREQYIQAFVPPGLVPESEAEETVTGDEPIVFTPDDTPLPTAGSPGAQAAPQGPFGDVELEIEEQNDGRFAVRSRNASGLGDTGKRFDSREDAEAYITESNHLTELERPETWEDLPDEDLAELLDDYDNRYGDFAATSSMQEIDDPKVKRDLSSYRGLIAESRRRGGDDEGVDVTPEGDAGPTPEAFTPRDWPSTWVNAAELDEHIAGLTPEQRAAEFNENFGKPRSPSPRSRIKKLDDTGLEATFDALDDSTPDDLRREFKIELARRGLLDVDDTAAGAPAAPAAPATPDAPTAPDAPAAPAAPSPGRGKVIDTPGPNSGIQTDGNPESPWEGTITVDHGGTSGETDDRTGVTTWYDGFDADRVEVTAWRAEAINSNWPTGPAGRQRAEKLWADRAPVSNLMEDYYEDAAKPGTKKWRNIRINAVELPGGGWAIYSYDSPGSIGVVNADGTWEVNTNLPPAGEVGTTGL